MISDYSVPRDCQPSGTAETVKRPRYLRGRWIPEEIERLAGHLDASGRARLGELSDEEILTAWSAAIAALLDPGSPTRRALDPALQITCRLTAPALQAALEAMLGGTLGAPAGELLQRGARLERRRRGLVVAILASNVPALAVQVLLPALALRRPLLLKSSSREPLLSAALVHLLGRQQPALSQALAAVTWRGGEPSLEQPVFEVAKSIVAFGNEETLGALGSWRPDILGHGPMLSLAVVSRDADLPTVARGLASDIALFEQRGCLSVQAVLTDGDAQTLATALAAELRTLAELWPPPQLDIETAAAVQQLRLEASLRDLPVADLPIETGTVVLESDARLRPVPGLRSVRIHPLDDMNQTEAMLEPHRGRIQGVALAGAGARSLKPLLDRLGVSRTTPAGDLQRPDALWANGETHLIERLA